MVKRLVVTLDDEAAEILAAMMEVEQNCADHDEDEQVGRLLSEGVKAYKYQIDLAIERMQGQEEEQDDPKLKARRTANEEKVFSFLAKHIQQVGFKNLRPGGIAWQFYNDVCEMKARMSGK
jgi:hypothetical protein